MKKLVRFLELIPLMDLAPQNASSVATVCNPLKNIHEVVSQIVSS